MIYNVFGGTLCLPLYHWTILDHLRGQSPSAIPSITVFTSTSLSSLAHHCLH